MRRQRIEAIKSAWIESNYRADPAELDVATLKHDLAWLVAELEATMAGADSPREVEVVRGFIRGGHNNGPSALSALDNLERAALNRETT